MTIHPGYSEVRRIFKINLEVGAMVIHAPTGLHGIVCPPDKIHTVHVMVSIANRVSRTTGLVLTGGKPLPCYPPSLVVL